MSSPSPLLVAARCRVGWDETERVGAAYSSCEDGALISSVMVQLDDELLAPAEKRAAISGKPREKVIAEAVRRGLSTDGLQTVLAAGRTGTEITEPDAIELAVEEQRRYRAERAADKNTMG